MKQRVQYVFDLSEMDDSNGQFSLCRNMDTLSDTEVEFEIDDNFQNKNFGKSSRILIVDDEAFNRMAVKVILGTAGVKDPHEICDTANHGEMALQMIIDDF